MKLTTKFLQMVAIFPDSEEIIKSLLQLGTSKVRKRKEEIKYQLDDRGKVVFVHKKLKRFHVTVPVKRKSLYNYKGRLHFKTETKKKKLKLFPKKKPRKTKN